MLGVVAMRIASISAWSSSGRRSFRSRAAVTQSALTSTEITRRSTDGGESYALAWRISYRRAADG